MLNVEASQIALTWLISHWRPFFITGTMVVAGCLGALCRRSFESDRRRAADQTYVKPRLDSSVWIQGITAAFIVPLFLSMGRSDVFKQALAGTYLPENLMIIFGFCVLAGFSAEFFVNAIARQALREAETANDKADAATNLAIEAKEAVANVEIDADDSEVSPAGGNLPQIGTSADAVSLIAAQYHLDENERGVLEYLLTSGYIRSSMAAINKKSGIPRAGVLLGILGLQKKGLVLSVRSQKTGSVLYTVSPNVRREDQPD